MTRKFEEMLGELKGVVKKMEDPDTGLDESIALYERGAALIRECERKLAEAELKVTEVTEGCPPPPRLSWPPRAPPPP